MAFTNSIGLSPNQTGLNQGFVFARHSQSARQRLLGAGKTWRWPRKFRSSPSTGGGAAASVEMAKKYVGQSAISLKGKLDNYTAAGGTGNDCADFVSGILANTQGFKKQPVTGEVPGSGSSQIF